MPLSPHELIFQRESEQKRFWAKVRKTDTCWLWEGGSVKGRSGHAYGQFNLRNKKCALVHRISYTNSKGPIPQSMQVDHICHETKCVNPEHLRAVTHKQNSEYRKGASTRSASGVRGVYWDRTKGKWGAAVGHNWRTLHVGYFATIEEAEAAVIEFRAKLFTYEDYKEQES